MLVDLRVKNFALIDKLDINIEKGLNVITGETGAGKSIIIGALDMLLGARASTDVIRNEQEKAYIEAVFEPENIERINSILEKAGIEPEENILLLSREIRLNGRNRSRINGQLATLGMVRELSKYLVDIHGQHDHQSLLDFSLHLTLLDEYLGEEADKLLIKISEEFKRLQEIEQRLKELQINETEKARELDILQFQINEIKQAGLKPGEEKELKEQYNKLTNIEEIFSITGQLYSNINGEDFNQTSLLDELGLLMKEIDKIKDLDSELNNMYKQLNDVFYQLQDLGYQVNDYHEKLEFNQGKLKQIEDRLNLLNSLMKKYGNSVEEILEYKEEIISRYDDLQSREKLIRKMENEKEETEDKYLNLARQLSELRKNKAHQFEKQIMKEFSDLALKDTIFKVDFRKKSPTENGIDRVEFLISTNPGEELKSLINIASGGELSRIMLALKTIIADLDQVETLVFDEVDIGVGGKTAQKMAEKLYKICQHRQVICITHLPQIASMSDHHFYITKETRDTHTYTNIKSLNREQKKKELARMLGGVKQTETTLKHAEEMMQMADNKKSKL